MRRTPQSTIEGLQAALAAEHSSIYGYGVLGSRLRGVARQSARDMWSAHRSRRDRLIAALTALDTAPVPASAAYRLPVEVTSARAAAQLAALLEEGVVNAYVGLAGADDPNLRRLAAQAMQEATARAVRWRGSAPATAFPGLPGSALRPQPNQ